MTWFCDGIDMIGIRMAVWDHTNTRYRPSFEKDFFDVGNLKEDKGVYLVENDWYLVDQVSDWKNGTGDYRDEYEGEPGHTPDDRLVEIERR